jgi:hypothetical protein
MTVVAPWHDVLSGWEEPSAILELVTVGLVMSAIMLAPAALEASWRGCRVRQSDSALRRPTRNREEESSDAWPALFGPDVASREWNHKKLGKN